MCRKIILYIAASLDGYIAHKDGGLDWLPDIGDIDVGFDAFYSGIDTVVMGRTTYEQVTGELSPDVWPYAGKACYVATTTKRKANEHAAFVTEDIVDFIDDIKQRPGDDIWLVGGGKLIHPFIQRNMIDSYIISVMPVILGGGIPLFLPGSDTVNLRLVETKTYGDIAELHYERASKNGTEQ